MIKRIIYILLSLLFLFIIYTMSSTGFFRTIEDVREYEVHKEIGLWGAEDITISRTDSFAIISSTKRNSYPPVGEERGDLYFMDLKNEDFEVQKLTGHVDRYFAPHGISIFQTSDSTYQVAVINHTEGGHAIELFQLQNGCLLYTSPSPRDRG